MKEAALDRNDVSGRPENETHEYSADSSELREGDRLVAKDGCGLRAPGATRPTGPRGGLGPQPQRGPQGTGPSKDCPQGLGRPQRGPRFSGSGFGGEQCGHLPHPAPTPRQGIRHLQRGPRLQPFLPHLITEATNK